MRALAAASVFALYGCVEINGGAVEFGWLIRAGSVTAASERGIDEGDSVDCDRADITEVRLSDTDPDGETRAFGFDCDDKRGSTDFILPEGRHLFAIEAFHDEDPVKVAVPSPISAQVRTGEVTDLQILVIRLP